MRLHDALRKISQELGLKGPYSHDSVIAEIRRQYPKLIDDNSIKLQDIALKRLLNDLDSKQSRAFIDGQGDLFGVFAGLPTSVNSRVLGVGKAGERMLLQTLSARLVETLLNRPEPRRKNSTPKERLREFYDQVKSYAVSGDETLEELVRKSRDET
ncbi:MULTISPECIES: hypothetical protein [Rhizobium]|uniref:hypothetical protein n=1 Tax=Rhizobium TaxID=379 RepID=UPI00195E7298|nr:MULTISPECIES: hypothetical protein [Rhizobium]MBM7048073.1 hypothetical protein [Rhizobium lusitanum]